MSHYDLTELKRLLAEATPELWERCCANHSDDTTCATICADGEPICEGMHASFTPDESGEAEAAVLAKRTRNLNLICALRNSAPALIEEVERLREAMKAASDLMRETISGHRDPKSGFYNNCEIEGGQCMWCAEALAAIERGEGEGK